MKTKEPPYTEPYVRWCGRTVNKIIIYLLPDFEPRRGSKFEVSAVASVDYTVRSISTPFSSIAFKSSSNASSSVIRTSKALIGQMLIIESVPILLVG